MDYSKKTNHWTSSPKTYKEFYLLAQYMELNYSKEKIEFKKELNEMDKFFLDFVSVLDKLNINYVLVSGYIAILFGRSRSSEDIDIICEKIDIDKFKELWTEINKNFECIITSDFKEAYDKYLLKQYSIRFSRKNKFIPNIEIKFHKSELDLWTLKNKKKVIVNAKTIFIAPIELQIPFKLYLGKENNEKDIEDAKYLYNLFKEYLDLPLLNEFIRKLNIGEMFNKYLK